MTQLQSYASTLYSNYYLANQKLNDVGDDLLNAGQQELWENANGFIVDSAYDLSGLTSAFRVKLYYAFQAIHDAILWIDANWPSDGEELTWQSILEAWTYNEYEGAVATVYVIDKMRRLAWNRPYLLAHALNPEEYQE